MGELSCGMKCLKYILFAFNFIFWIAGIGVLGVGIWSRIHSKDYDSVLGSGGFTSAANLMIAAGIFVMIVGFFGCCGALRESKWMLVMYFIFLLLIFGLEIAGGILAYLNKDKALDEIKKNIKKTVDTDFGKSGKASEGLTKAVNFFQQELKCCGSSGYMDWKNSTWRRGLGVNTTISVPKSCCKDENKAGCNENIVPNSTTIYTKGCVDAAEKYVKDHMVIIGGVGVGIAMLQLLGMIFSMCLCRQIGYEKI